MERSQTSNISRKIAGMDDRLKRVDASDERQYMINEHYEVYEKQGPPLGAVSIHYHNFYEIIYVLEGEYSSMIENQTYVLHRGDFLLIDQNVMHKYIFMEKKHDNSKRIILWVTPQMLRELSGGDMDLAACFTDRGSGAYHFPVYYEEMLRGYLLKLAMSEAMQGELPGARQVLDRGYLTLFFAYLNTLCGRKEYFFTDENIVSQPMVEQVGEYIERNIGRSITVEELAEHVHMSKYHFLRKFKELTGVTVHAFVTNKRLIRACELLRENVSITQVCTSVGFTDYSSFLRNFKSTFGVSPGKYADLYS